MVRLSFLFIIILSVGFSCQQNKSAQGNNTQTQGIDNTSAQKIRFISLQNGQVIKIGQNLSLKIKYDDTSKSPDSIQFQLDAIRIGAVKKTSEALDWKAPFTKTGLHVISAVAYFSAVAKEQVNMQVKLYPGKTATPYIYKIIREYPHDHLQGSTQPSLYCRNNQSFL